MARIGANPVLDTISSMNLVMQISDLCMQQCNLTNPVPRSMRKQRTNLLRALDSDSHSNTADDNDALDELQFSSLTPETQNCLRLCGKRFAEAQTIVQNTFLGDEEVEEDHEQGDESDQEGDSSDESDSDFSLEVIEDDDD